MEAKHEEYMKEALSLARKAADEGEIPVGALVVKGDRIVGRGYNKREKGLDVSSHAEIEALKDAAKVLGDWRLEGCSLYVTLEPCLMCSGAILQSRISSLYFGARDPQEGAVVSKYFVFEEPRKGVRPLIHPDLLADECQKALDGFFKKHRAK